MRHAKSIRRPISLYKQSLHAINGLLAVRRVRNILCGHPSYKYVLKFVQIIFEGFTSKPNAHGSFLYLHITINLKINSLQLIGLDQLNLKYFNGL